MSNKRQRTNSAAGSEEASRSTSGGSTASRETSAVQSKLVQNNERRYAPIRPMSQPPTQLQSQPPNNQNTLQHAIALPEKSPSHDVRRYIHDFNRGQQTPLDPEFRTVSPSHTRPGSAPYSHQRHISDQYAGSEGLTDFAPLNGQTANMKRGKTTIPGAGQEKKERKPPSNNATNEKELRELIENNYHRSLDSIAQDVRNAERTQKSEKAKQLFAMRWLREFCRTDKDSVPRSRVYTHYTQRCGTERVDTLNPASFGKLVRVIFPGINTRRLGVRGESKYHYVSLALVEDPQAQYPRPQSSHASVGHVDRATPFEPEAESRPPPRLPVDSSAFPQESSFEPQPQHIHVNSRPSQGQLFADQLSPDLQGNQDGPQMYTQTLRFTSDQASQADELLSLPDISPFVAPKTDVELAETLVTCYRTHCTSLVDHVRYVRERQFIRLLGTFNGTMTVPVAKLFAQSNIAPWIKWCDWLMYQQIIRFASKLALQVMPPQVFTMLRNISNDLTTHLQRSFRTYPQHVLQAKLEPATIFAGLIDRLLRVNETAHAAANLLMNDEVRANMWQDFVRNVRSKRVIETALPSCGHDEAHQIITMEIRQLLEPLPPFEYLEFGTEYQNAFAKSNCLGSTDQRPESIIERWSNFLQSLPGRFPEATTRAILHSLEAVGNAVLRDITVNQATSFGAWWIAKVWVDEMMLWNAAMGGFLDFTGVAPLSPSHLDTFESFLEHTRKNSMNVRDRPSSAGLGLDFSTFPVFSPVHNGLPRPSSGPPTATFKFTPRPGGVPESMHLNGHDDNDDSGIGMSLLDEAADLAVESTRPAFSLASG
ncbi:MAG: hypothetical protein M1828_005198 [Chrysothrix sp. TS-e1954]|nr:MAG: hypothetical protein M1828_005198 [Chrysothrix sp. TS-e1954]